ncbi:hypothetical protein WN71_001015 [Streptomyces mangrovisoli]|uniref:Uncharacterized protein n=1 Tax=Streptomyces mangrovisoli TaxID=1428628 RepID=A0A1J4P6E1_9ACTN|nr:hypothetical protein WN71_001015 [Streptomyces mangrovisoli]
MGAAALAGVFAVAGCSADAGTAGAASSSSWEFEHVFDFHGEITDFAVLAEDDIWVAPVHVGSKSIEDNGNSKEPLLHFDGKSWQRGPLPENFGTTDSAIALHEIGDKALWMEWHRKGAAFGVNSWAEWDGERWSAVARPPQGSKSEHIAATGPKDVWMLVDDRTAQHWDGTRWTVTRLPYTASDLAAAGPDDVWAVGSRSTGPGTDVGSGDFYEQPASMHWDGTSWKSVETPQYHFDEPIPPEAGAHLDQVIALDGGQVLAYGLDSFNEGEGGKDPDEQYIRLRWEGSKWVAQKPAPGKCARLIPVAQDDAGQFFKDNLFLTSDNRCVKIKTHRLAPSTGARKDSKQVMGPAEVHRIPGTDEWLGAGEVVVSQSGAPFSAPVVVRLKRG